ncbi:hypothetical protein JFK97_19065 [Chromobacterium phragmitis]|uniref:hypothetical protein n=1 Tax=Chromobacterium amazonense TaxID=1382803 RepID=UPI0021B7ECE0|nr:hypothetical protein [Chromobacterium amazonense]MBM2886494.1 hypothetical protein [Chromobacterium amazonense]
MAKQVIVGIRVCPELDRIFLELATGLELALPIRCATGGVVTTAVDLADFAIVNNGLAVRFNRVGTELHLPELLAALPGFSSWAVAEIGRVGGRATSAAKTAAAHQNGKLGGRPRKATP